MYKVGDEVFVKGEVVEVMQAIPYPYRVKIGEKNHLLAECEAVSLTKTYEQGLAEGRKEGLGLAKKIGYEPKKGGFSNAELMEIFGTAVIEGIYDRFTVEEVLAKIEAYEKEKEIKVGDEVVHGCDGCGINFYVTYLTQNQIKGFSKDGDTHYFVFPNPYIKRTGKHIDIEGILKQIGE